MTAQRFRMRNRTLQILMTPPTVVVAVTLMTGTLLMLAAWKTWELLETRRT